MEPEIDEVPTVRIAAPPGRAFRTAAITVVAIVLALILKPWDAIPRASLATPSPPPASTRQPIVSAYLMQGDRPYDPVLFGAYEARPAWEIWPAGYIVEIGFAGPRAIGAATPAPAASASPPATAASQPEPTPPPGASELLDLGRSENIGVIGLNTPLDTSVTVALWRLDGARLERLEIVELEPPWRSSHFHVYGLAPSDGGRVLEPWLPAVYRLDLLGPSIDEFELRVSIGLLVRDR